jgi:NTP pyrophosphatase (non-canonical NTP hydrolase)
MTKDEYFEHTDKRLRGPMPVNVLLGGVDSGDRFRPSTGNLVADAVVTIKHDLSRPCNWGDALDSTTLVRAEAEALLAFVEGATRGNADALTFGEYSTQALATAIYPGASTIECLMYLSLKLAGEAGEVAQKIAKAVRDNASVIDETRRLALLDECGDVLWYTCAIATELNSSLAEVAQRNLAKIKNRQARNAQHGDGDNR